MAQQNLTLPQALNKLAWSKKQTSYAWAKFYTQVNAQLHDDHGNHDTFNRVADDKSVPEHLKTELKAMATALAKKWECPVCIDMISDANLEITNCGHFYCRPCLAAWQKQQRDGGKAKWKCGMCNREHGFP